MNLHSVNFPYWDDYEILRTFRDIDSGTSLIKEIFSWHNEHRIVLFRVISLIDTYLFGEINFRRLIAIGSLFYMLIPIFLYIKVDRLFAWFCLLLFTLPVWQFWSWSLASIANSGAFLFGLISVYHLHKNNWIYTILFSILSLFSTAQGIVFFVFCPIYFLLKIELNLKKRLIFSLFSFLIFLLVFTLYRIGAPSTDFILDNFYLLPFHYLTVLGSHSYLVAPSIILPIILGILIICLILYNIINSYRKSTQIEFPEILAVYTLLIPGLISIGRYGMGVEQALASRYLIYSTLLFSYFFFRLQNKQLIEGELKKTSFVIIVLAFILLSFMNIKADFLNHKSKMQLSKLGYELNFKDHLLYPDKNQAFQLLNFAKKNNLFYSAEPKLLVHTAQKKTYQLEKLNTKDLISRWSFKYVNDSIANISGWLIVQDKTSSKLQIELCTLSNIDESDMLCTPLTKFIRKDVVRNFNNRKYLFSGFNAFVECAPKDYCLVVTDKIERNTYLAGCRNIENELFLNFKPEGSENSSNIIQQWKIEKLENHMKIEGWACMKDIVGPDQDVYFIIQSNSRELRKIKLKSKIRKDVTKHFNDNNNYDNTGFYDLIPNRLFKDLPSEFKGDNIKVGLLIKCKTKSAYTLSKQITIQ